MESWDYQTQILAPKKSITMLSIGSHSLTFRTFFCSNHFSISLINSRLRLSFKLVRIQRTNFSTWRMKYYPMTKSSKSFLTYPSNLVFFPSNLWFSGKKRFSARFFSLKFDMMKLCFDLFLLWWLKHNLLQILNVHFQNFRSKRYL